MRHFIPLTVLLGFVLPLSLASAEIPVVTSDRLLVHEEPGRYWKESLSGGPSKDGIPSIDKPRFESIDRADRWLKDGDRIIGLFHNGEARAYPQRILVWHEIVNDTVGGEGIAITYCPLTGTSLGFKRGKSELGVSGRLVNSNLIMYDRQTDSYWPQILATAVEGSEKGKQLVEVRLIWTSWRNWKQRYPESDVLSRRTGYARNYRRDAYGSYSPKGGYYAGGDVIFPLFHHSDRYQAKHEIFGFRTQSEAVAVDREALALSGSLRHEGTDGVYLILHDAGLDTAWVYRSNTDDLPDERLIKEVEFTPEGPKGEALEGLESVNGFEAMWFAWHAFYPETEVVDDGND